MECVRSLFLQLLKVIVSLRLLEAKAFHRLVTSSTSWLSSLQPSTEAKAITVVLEDDPGWSAFQIHLPSPGWCTACYRNIVI